VGSADQPPPQQGMHHLAPGSGGRAVGIALFVFYGSSCAAMTGATILDQNAATGVPFGLGVVATLVAMCVAPGLAIWWVGRHGRRVEAVRRRIVNTLRDRGVNATLHTVGGSGGNRFALVFSDDRAQLPTGLTLSRQGLPVPDLKTGDVAFDKDVRVSGDPLEASSALNAEGRARFLKLLELAPKAELHHGRLKLELNPWTSLDTVVEAAEAMADAIEGLRRPEDAPAALAAIARNDEDGAVRRAALLQLLDSAPGAPAARALADELLAGDDLQAALVVARTLGMEERAAELTSLGDSQRGKLGLAEEQGGEVALAGRRAGALSKTPEGG
jgi:hypothetical protein